jgi:multidrug efflux pump subunit AcrA (membrane-fusion protein)
MRKIAAAVTCTALTVGLTACGGTSEDTKMKLSSQRAQVATARATLADQRATLEADQTALAERKANAVRDIKKARDKLRTQASDLRDTVSQLRSRVDGLRGQVRSESATLRDLQRKASGARYLVRHGSIPGTGTFLVNKEISPGTYRAGASAGCYWERQASLDGGIDSIADNDNADGPVIVAISSSDVAFKTSGCATFHKVG